MQIADIFVSLQGEGKNQGRPCLFIRLAGCNLDCTWCDTKESRTGGISMSMDTVLEQVWRDEKEEQATEPLPAGADIPAPLEIAPGRYYISIREIQGKRPEVSSKQVLRSFVQHGTFSELEIVCDHVPPWIEMDAERLGYELTSERTGLHDVKVLIRRPAGGCC